MIKATMTSVSAVLAAGLLAAGAHAAPLSLTAGQMDSVTGGAFVCPVIFTDAVLNSPNGAAIGEGHYTIIGPTLPDSVPMHATNGDGSGTPAGPHAAPGDSDYTAIWY